MNSMGFTVCIDSTIDFDFRISFRSVVIKNRAPACIAQAKCAAFGIPSGNWEYSDIVDILSRLYTKEIGKPNGKSVLICTIRHENLVHSELHFHTLVI